MADDHSESPDSGGRRGLAMRVGFWVAAAGLAVWVFFVSERRLGPVGPELGFESVFGLPPGPVSGVLVAVGLALLATPLLGRALGDRDDGGESR